MGLIDLFRRLWKGSAPKELNDPNFGRIIEERNGTWTTEVDGITIMIPAGDAGPTDRQRDIFITMRQRQAELNAMIEEPLFSEYSTIRAIEQTGYERQTAAIASRFGEDFPEIQRPSEIWKIAHLASVTIYGEGYDFDLVFDFEIDWADNEHWLDVRFKDWKVIEVGKEG